MVSHQSADEFPRCSVEPPVKDAGKIDAQIMSANALQRVFPTTVASCCLAFRGWIHQETLCNRSSATCDLRQCAVVTSEDTRLSWVSWVGNHSV